MEPEIMLFDEATSALLNPGLISEALRTMQELKNDGMTILVEAHEMPDFGNLG